jgi:WD repeat-containing protein 45
MSYRKEVKAVKLKTDRIIVVCENKIFIYNLVDMKFLDFIDTAPNQLGLCSVNYIGDYTIIAAPDKEIGYVLLTYS